MLVVKSCVEILRSCGINILVVFSDIPEFCFDYKLPTTKNIELATFPEGWGGGLEKITSVGVVWLFSGITQSYVKTEISAGRNLNLQVHCACTCMLDSSVYLVLSPTGSCMYCYKRLFLIN